MFSIVVPVYNVETYIEKCLNSLINQTLLPEEVIIVDDGSMDKSSEICKEYATKFDFIHYFRKKNGGLSDARNFGIKHATKEFIIFLDSDDYLNETACQQISEKVKKNSDLDIIIGNAKKVEKDRTTLMMNSDPLGSEQTGKQYYLNSLNSNSLLVTTWVHIYRRLFLLKNDLFFKVGIYHEDEEHTPRALLAANKVLPTDIVFYNYLIRENSITTSSDKLVKRTEDLISTYGELRKIIDSNKDILAAYDNYWTSVFLQYYLRNEKVRKNVSNPINKETLKKMSAQGKVEIQRKIFVFSTFFYRNLMRINNVIKNF